MPNLFGESPRRSPCPANQFLPVRFLSGHCADAHDAHPPRRRPRDEAPQPPRDDGRDRQPDGRDDVILPAHCSEYQYDPVYDPRHEPGQRRVVNHRRRGPFPPGFGADGNHCGDAGHVEQDEHQERQRRGRREVAAREQPLRERGRLLLFRGPERLCRRRFIRFLR